MKIKENNKKINETSTKKYVTWTIQANPLNTKINNWFVKKKTLFFVKNSNSI